MDATKTVLDFSDFVQDKYGVLFGPTLEKWTNLRPRSSRLFFSRRGYCPFCREPAPIVHHVNYAPKHTAAPIHESEETRVWECQRCGWWEMVFGEKSIDHCIGRGLTVTLRHAVLKSFPLCSIGIPIQILRNALAKRCDYLYQIAPAKMELLVKDVFSDFFQCRVEHCGRTGDGGIDLLVIDGDAPFAIQVKRRCAPQSVEGVATVRSFLGAMLLRGFQWGGIVTTAHHFTKAAINEGKVALEKRLVRGFELVDARRFFDMFALLRETCQPAWVHHKPYKGLRGWPLVGCSPTEFEKLESRVNLNAAAWRLGL